MVPFGISSRTIRVLMKGRGITKDTNDFMLREHLEIFHSQQQCLAD